MIGELEGHNNREGCRGGRRCAQDAAGERRGETERAQRHCVSHVGEIRSPIHSEWERPRWDKNKQAASGLERTVQLPSIEAP